jgi:hypothetical protein
MVNLLERYGIKNRGKKRMSISFVDDMLDCSYRTFLKYFVGLPQDDGVNIPTTFGSGCHRGLARINRSMREDRIPCLKCKHECHINTPGKKNAMDIPIEECKVKQILMDEFHDEFDEDFRLAAIEDYIRKNDKDKGIAILDKMERLALPCMSEALFVRQPVGDIVVVEDFMSGKVGDFDICGVIDLVLIYNGNKVLVVDYKTAGKKPSMKSFPLRQLALYINMLQSKDLPVNGIAALYMVKTEPPKKPRKGSAPHQQTYLNFFNVDKNIGLYNHIIEQVHEDMLIVDHCVKNGIFMRNRKSMFCPCEFAPYCENNKKLEKFLSNKK